ncbi:MAG: hypothetical protein ABI607_11060 [Betaproteobacteria bacterium]
MVIKNVTAGSRIDEGIPCTTNFLRFMFYAAHSERALSAWRVLYGAWLDGIDRQQGVQADAINS